jgi:hypothetical protein
MSVIYRSVAVLVVAIAVVGAAGATPGPPVSHYESDAISFSYPSAWTASVVAGFFHYEPLVFVSNETLGKPCSTVGNATTCGWPVKALHSGGVVGAWFRTPVPIVGPLRGPGRWTTIDGHRALLSTSRQNVECTRIGGQLDVRALLKSPPLDFEACLRGPRLAKIRTQILVLLASTQFGR